MAIAFCPECEEGVSLGPRPRIGQRVTCPHCNAELEVVDLSPVELDWAYDELEVDWEEEEDWDEEDDWDEEEDDEDL
jgi:transcription initiation factor IIE alpha subunit